MKKKILLFTLTAGMGYVMLTSNASGPTLNSGGNKSGAKATATNCGGGGCHGGESSTVMANIRIDSVGGVEVTKYVAGMTYTVTVTGSHASLTRFGFQFASVSGSGMGQVQAGTFGTSLPAQVAKRTLGGVDFIEQNATITGPLSKTFTWTAPAATVSPVTMYLTVNAVNGNGSADGADLSHNVSKVLNVHTAPPSTFVANVVNTIGVKAFPNPVAGDLNIQVGNAYSNYSLQVFDITGRTIMNSQIAANVTGSTSINTANWAPGVYQVVVTNENSRETIQVVKQ